MTTSILLEEASRLGVLERIELVEAIWDSLAADAESLPLTAEHRSELDLRLADLEANPGAESAWTEVRARLERRGR